MAVCVYCRLVRCSAVCVPLVPVWLCLPRHILPLTLPRPTTRWVTRQCCIQWRTLLMCISPIDEYSTVHALLNSCIMRYQMYMYIHIINVLPLIILIHTIYYVILAVYWIIAVSPIVINRSVSVIVMMVIVIDLHYQLVVPQPLTGWSVICEVCWHLECLLMLKCSRETD